MINPPFFMAYIHRPGVGKFFSAKNQIVDFLGFVGQDLCLNNSTVLYHKSSHRQYINEWAWLYSNKTIYKNISGLDNPYHIATTFTIP